MPLNPINQPTIQSNPVNSSYRGSDKLVKSIWCYRNVSHYQNIAKLLTQKYRNASILYFYWLKLIRAFEKFS